MGTRQMVLDFIASKEIVPMDAETRGMDPHTKKLLSIQIGDKDNQYIVDCESMKDLLWLKEPLESKTLLGHNIKFDIKFLLHYNIIVTKVWDTFLAEKIINNGYVQIRNSLEAVVER